MVIKSPPQDISSRANILIDNYTEAVAQEALKYAHTKSQRLLINNNYHVARNKLEQYIASMEKKINDSA